MKKLLPVIPFLFVLLSGCGKNNSDEPAPDLLLGRWEQQGFKDISYDANGAIVKSDIRDTSTSGVYVVFSTDGRWEEHTPYSTVWQTYTRSGNTLTYVVRPLNGPIQYVDLLIEELTTTTLKTHFEQTTASGKRIYDTVYKRP